MRLSFLTSYLTLLCAVQALSLSKSENALSARDNLDTGSTPADFFSRLEKRKGGGRGGGSSSGGGGTGGGGGGRVSSPGASYNAQPNSNVGGRTSTGTGVTPRFGAGGNRAYYGGGAQVPYRAGDRKGSLAPVLLPLTAMALIFPGIWLWGVYSYNFDRPYHFYNRSYVNDTVNGLNQTLPVVCLCEKYVSCGCEENSDQAYINDLVGNGSYNALNKSVVNVAKDPNDGVTKLFINGTLANGTTAAGGEDSAAISLKVLQFSGWWVVIAMTVYAVCIL